MRVVLVINQFTCWFPNKCDSVEGGNGGDSGHHVFSVIVQLRGHESFQYNKVTGASLVLKGSLVRRYSDIQSFPKVL